VGGERGGGVGRGERERGQGGGKGRERGGGGRGGGRTWGGSKQAVPLQAWWLGDGAQTGREQRYISSMH
jgi:hypothetical protein